MGIWKENVMLRVLREHATSWMLRGLLVLVAVTFISWGGYSLIREKNVDYAARVNGEDIGLKEFTDAYQAAVKQYRDALGASFSEKMLDELKLKENIIEDLIGRVLILQEAKRLGLAVGDTELREAIEAVPAFQVNGQFDQRTYERALQWNRATPEQFEQSQRTRLMMTKLVNVIRLNGGRISDDEVLEVYRFENERINLSFIKVAPGSFVPPPKVDSAVVSLERRARPLIEVEDEAAFRKFLSAAFAQRRKTLANNLAAAGAPPERVAAALNELGLDPRVRAEAVPIRAWDMLYPRTGWKKP